MLLLYTFITAVVTGVLRLVKPFLRGKSKLWVAGRENWPQKYGQQFQPGPQVLWMHVSSLGEFEQGRPVLETFRRNYPDWQIVLTFFSPSGYELRKNYSQADFVAYLPVDSPGNARKFLDMIQPQLVIFVKYDFWPHYLKEIKKRQIPLYLIAALFRQEQPFFQWYGQMWREMLMAYTHIFAQTAETAKLLESIGYQDTTVCGDPRVDRVLDIAAQPAENEIVARFTQKQFVIVAGSSWGKDETILFEALQQPELSAVKLVCAPHQPSVAHVQQLCERWGERAVRYSQVTAATDLAQYRCLIIDNVGMLNTLYRYGTLAYIGGGFGAGIHNTLEPAAYGLPVIFGPNYHKFEEAKQLMMAGGAFCVVDTNGLYEVLTRLKNNTTLTAAGAAVQQYMQKSKGATAVILARITASPT